MKQSVKDLIEELASESDTERLMEVYEENIEFLIDETQAAREECDKALSSYVHFKFNGASRHSKLHWSTCYVYMLQARDCALDALRERGKPPN